MGYNLRVQLKLYQGEKMVNKYIDTISIVRLSMQTVSQQTKLPIYRVIALAISNAIQDQLFQENTKLPPVRILADALSVTPGTIAHAYEILEKEALITKRIGDGSYVNVQTNLYGKDFSNLSSNNQLDIDLRLNAHIDVGNAQVYAGLLRQYAQSSAFLERFTRYSPEDGEYMHRKAGVICMQWCGVDSTAEQIIPCYGAQHALFILLTALVKSGGYVAASKLSYPGLMTAARSLNIKLLGLEFDRDGVTPDSLLLAIQKHPIQVLYLTPSLDNPTTSNMPESRRLALAVICQKANIKIISDETLAIIAPTAQTSFTSIYPEGTFVITSLSKALGPSLKLGFIHAPVPALQHLFAVVKSISWSGDHIMTEVACLSIQDGTAERLKQKQAEQIQQRIHLIQPILDRIKARYQNYCGHVWVELPEPWRASVFADELKKHHILIHTAERFAIGRAEIPQAVRIAICKPNSTQLVQALECIESLITSEVD